MAGGLKVDVGVDNLGPIESLKRLRAALDNQDILDEAGAFFLGRVRTRYLSEVAPNGNPWAPSKAAIDRRLGGGSGTLFDTGRLFHSIQLSAESSNDLRVISTDVPYAPFLHFGFIHWKSKQQVGPWPFMGLSAEDADIFSRLLKLRVEKAIG